MSKDANVSVVPGFTAETEERLGVISTLDADIWAFRSTPPTINFFNPDPAIFEEAFTNMIWIELEAIPIYKLGNNVRLPAATTLSPNPTLDNNNQGLASELNSPRYKFKYLLTGELMETLGHDWQPYESVASGVAGLAAGLGGYAKEQLLGVLQATNIRKIGDIFGIPGRIGNAFTNKVVLASIKELGTKLATSGNVANWRVDTPLQYKGSERRSWELVFTLINVRSGGNLTNVTEQVKILQSLSSPAYLTDDEGNFKDSTMANTDIILPYLFRISSTPGDTLYCDLAVLKNVNPIYRGPWIGGEPSRCELRLSFMEYRPVDSKVFFSETHRNKGKIKTFLKERPTAYNESEKASQKQYNDYVAQHASKNEVKTSPKKAYNNPFPRPNTPSNVDQFHVERRRAQAVDDTLGAATRSVVKGAGSIAKFLGHDSNRINNWYK